MKRRIEHLASYKDPAAKVFTIENDTEVIYRELFADYIPHYHHFQSSGLAKILLDKKWIVPFEEEKHTDTIFLKAQRIPFITFPYEWTFNQWKDASLLTLKIQYQALKHGMVLKDATPFNIVFNGCTPLFIDLSSFEIFKGQAWQAYRQFSESFYMPLLLVTHFGISGNHIFSANINGIPLYKGLSLLPFRALVNMHTLINLVLPAQIRKKTSTTKKHTAGKDFNEKQSMQFSERLFFTINKLTNKKQVTKWNKYYQRDVTSLYLKEKEKLILNWLGKEYVHKNILDIGCNTGYFSKLCIPLAQHVIAFDGDQEAVDELYLYARRNKINNLSAFVADITQPSPGIGWNNKEREPLLHRMQADLILALGLSHHLSITHNINFQMIAKLFAGLCKELFIEFVPKSDEKVQLLLSQRVDVFVEYTIENFIAVFETDFTLKKLHTFSNGRTMLHFIVKDGQ